MDLLQINIRGSLIYPIFFLADEAVPDGRVPLP